MNDFWFTLLAAVVLMGFAVLCLAIGYLLSGKKLRRGCGLRPGDKKDKDSSCSLCGKSEPCEKDNDTKHD